MTPLFLRRATVMLLVLALLALGVAGVSAQDGGIETLDQALRNSGLADTVSFDFVLDATISGIPGAEATVNTATIHGSGSVGADFIDVALDGSSAVGGASTPINLSFRIVDNVLYFSQDGRVWTGTQLDELGPALEQFAITNYRQGFAGGSGLGGGTSDNDPAVDEAFHALLNSVLAIRLNDFATTELVDEDTGLPVAHYTTRLDVAALTESDAFQNLIVGLVQLGDPTMTERLTQAELSALSTMLGSVFSDTSVQLDTYVNLDTDFIDRFVLDIQATIDPSATGGGSGRPVSVAINFDIELHGFNTTPAVTAPEGAMVISNIAGLIGLDTPAQPIATLPPAELDPTATPVPPVAASQPIFLDQIVVASLTGTGPATFAYEGTAGEIVTITARSFEAGTVDTTLEVQSPTGQTIATNDDHASDLPELGLFDSALVDLELPADGTYTINVNSYSGSTIGDVEVAITSAGGQNLPPATEAPVSTTGANIAGNTPTAVNLSATGPTELIYSGAEGETITVIARSLEESGTIDPTVEVLSPNGTRLSFNDDHGSDLPNLAPFDSAIRDLVLPSAGDYTVRVTTFSGAGEGAVEVTVQSDMAPAPLPTPVGPEVTPVGPVSTPDVVLTGETDTVRGEVPSGSNFTYRFNGRPNQVTTITVIAGTTGDLDPKVSLIGPDGQVLAENDDHSDSDPSLGSLDSRISDFVLPAEGQYSVVVSGFASTSGPFELTIERAVEGGESILTPTAPDATPVARGEEQIISGQVRAGETFTYELQADAGDVYTIAVRGEGNLDPRLFILDPDGFVIAENDDHNSGDPTLDTLDSKVESLIIQDAGTYTIEVTDYSGSRGSFSLSITLVATGAPTGPGEDDVSLGSLEDGGLFTTTVDLNAGDFVSVTIRTVSGDLDPMVALIAPSGEVVAENDDHADLDSTLGRYDSRIPRMIVNETGSYTIEVTGYSGGGTFTITVNTLRGNN